MGKNGPVSLGSLKLIKKKMEAEEKKLKLEIEILETRKTTAKLEAFKAAFELSRLNGTGSGFLQGNSQNPADIPNPDAFIEHVFRNSKFSNFPHQDSHQFF